jgi:arsenite/tail-anchored protein-transporting ATPase
MTGTGGPPPAPLLLCVGVGDTAAATATAATAIRCAEAGHRTLLTALRATGALPTVFDRPPTPIHAPGPVPDVGGLWIAEPSAESAPDEVGGPVAGAWWEHLVGTSPGRADGGAPGTTAAGRPPLGEAMASAVTAPTAEVMVLAQILEVCESGAWDAVVIDAGTVAELVALLARVRHLSDAVASGRPGRGLLTRLLGASPPGPADPRCDAATLGLWALRSRIGDSGAVRACLVAGTHDEPAPVAEVRRDAGLLSFAGVQPDAVVVPETAVDLENAGVHPRVGSAGCTRAHLEARVAPLRVLWHGASAGPRGGGAGEERRFVGSLAGDVAAVWSSGRGQHTDRAGTTRHDPVDVRRDEGGYVLSIDLPFVGRHDLDLARRGDDLLVSVHGHQQAIELPDSLLRRPVDSARWHDGRLLVRFAADPG